MEEIRQQIWRKVVEMLLVLKFPAIIAVVALVISEPFWKAGFIGGSVGLAVGVAWPLLKKWAGRDWGERAYTDIAFGLGSMTELIGQKHPFQEWWAGISFLAGRFSANPTKEDAKILAHNMKMMIQQMNETLTEEQKHEAKAILERIETVLKA